MSCFYGNLSRSKHRALLITHHSSLITRQGRAGMHRGPGTLRTILIVLGSNWFTLVLSVLRVLVLPSKLGDSGLGQVTLAISFTTFFGIFTSLGASTYLVRAIAQDRESASRYISNALLLRVVMAGLVLAVLM